MDKILQQIGTFLGRKFSKIYTIFNDKYNELDNKKVDKEEGKELMPSPEGASDTVFLSETGWREVNTDKIRTHVISISIPFDSAWDFNGAQEITLEEGDYDRDEADSFIYDYFRYNNPNVVIRNTNTTAQSAQKGYHTVWKVALDTIAEGRALRLYLDIPKNLSFTMAPEADSAKFTRYCILLYLSQDEENQTYILNNIGILPNGTDSFIPRKYLDGKLSDITSSYLPLSGGLMTGNIAFPDGKGLGSAVGQSDLLVRSGNTVKLGSAGFSARLYAENPVVREGLEGMFTMYDTSNLDIDKPFVTDLWAVYDAEGKNTQSIAVDLYNPVAKSATKVYRELLPVTDTNMGLMTPSYKTALDRLIPSSGESLSIYGTPASTWQLTLGTGPKLKNSGGIFELRDNSDNAYTDLILNNITIKGNVTQEGSSFITKAETVEVSDNILLLNRGEVGSGVTKGISGLEIDRGKLPNYFIIFDESDDRFKCGTEGNQFPLMLRDNEPDMVDGAFLTWNSTFKRAQTTSTVPIQLALRFALQNLSEKDTDIIFKRVDNEIYLKYGDTNDKYLSLKVLDDILFKSSPSAAKYVFDKEIWAPSFKSDNGYEMAFIDPDISDRMFLQYDSDKKTIKALNAVYTDKGGLDFFSGIDDVDNQVNLSTQNGDFDITGLKASNAWNLVISPRVTLTRDGFYKIPILDILTSSHEALGFTNPIILDSYIGFEDQNRKFYGSTDSFTFDIAGDIIRFIPSRNRSLINTNSSELGFSANVIIPTGFRSSDLSQIVFANYSNLNKKYLAWDGNTNAITSIDGFDSLVVVNPNDPNKKLTLHYVNGGFSISSSSDVPNIEQNTIEITETIGSDGSVTYNLNSTYTPLHVNFPMWGNFCDEEGNPFVTVGSFVGHYLPLSAGSTNALTGPLYFSPTSALVNKTDTGENVWALFMGDSTNGTSLCLGSLGDLESVGNLSNTALLNINSSGNTHTIRLGYTDEHGNIKAGIVTSGANLSSQTEIHTVGNKDIKHYKNGTEYIIYDSSNLNVEELLQNYTLEGNIIGTPKATRIKAQNLSTLGDSIRNIDFRSVLWGSTTDDNWLIPWRTSAANEGTAGTNAAHIGWTVQNTHAYIGINQNSNNRAVIVGGGSNGTITWFESLAFKSDINNLSSVYYPYSGRGHMFIVVDGRPKLDNSYGILFSKTGGEMVEGIYMGSHNRIVVGGSPAANVPVEIYNDLGITRIIDRSTKFSLFTFTNGGTEDTQITHIGAEHGTTRIRSGLFNLVHDRGGTLYTVFDSYNFSRDLGSTNINSSFNHLPMMAAQPSNSAATTDRGYPIQSAGSLIVIPGVYGGSSQIYGTYDSNRWFVRGGSPTSNSKDEHTAWKELATTSHLSNYLPRTGGALTGSLFIGNSSQDAYNFIRIQRNNYTFETTVSGGNGILSLESSNSGVTPTALKISPGGHVYINDEELAKVSQVPSMSDYLPLSGGTLTRTISGPVLSLKNTSANKEAYMDFYRGNVKCGYIGAAATNTEDMYLEAYDSRNMSIGTNSGNVILRSGANDLIHSRKGTEYTILDTYNIHSLTIQFNGSTNTTYNPSVSRTVNITPAAIGAAARSHTHNYAASPSAGGPATYILDSGNGNNNIQLAYGGDGLTASTASHLVGINKTLVNGCRVFRDINPSEVRTLIDAAPSSHTHTRSQITDFPSSMPASDVYAWAKASTKPSYSWSEISGKPSIPSAETAATIMSKINSQSEITFSKHVVCSAGAGTSSTSDIRFKNNITPLAPVLSHVLGSPGFFYTWKDEDEVLVGTSAQYWEGRITGLVREINDKSKTKTFSYERYTVILQEALKEEHMLREAEKEEYRKEICSLRKELEDLKRLIQKLL